MNNSPKRKEGEVTLAEYKLVPAQEIESIEDEERPIDLIGEMKSLWRERATIFKVAGTVIGIGLIVFLFSERLYNSNITLMPEVQDPESASSQLLRQYGGMLGISGGVTNSSETISVDLYPEIVESTPYQLELIQEELYFAEYDTTVSLFTYYHEIREPPFFDRAGTFLWNMTFGLPGTIKGLFSSNSSERPDVNFEAYKEKEGPFDLDGRISQVINFTSGLISVEQQPQTGFILISAELPDAVASAQLVKAVKKQLTEYVTEYRTEKVMADLKYIRVQYNTAKERFQQAQDSLASFRDRNMNLATARAQTQEQRLQAEYDLRFQVYNSLAQRLEQSKLKVQEETPVFSTLEPVKIPGAPSSPNATRILLGSIFLGLFLGVTFIYMRRFYNYLVHEFKSR